jgi:hypothetical protein
MEGDVALAAGAFDLGEALSFAHEPARVEGQTMSDHRRTSREGDRYVVKDGTRK